MRARGAVIVLLALGCVLPTVFLSADKAADEAARKQLVAKLLAVRTQGEGRKGFLALLQANAKLLSADLVWDLCQEADALQSKGAELAEVRRVLAIAEFIAEQTKDKESRAHVLCCTGVIAFYRSDNASALAAYEKALPLYQQVGNKLAEATVYRRQGEVYFYTGDSASALKANEKALPLYQQVGDRRGEANVYWRQGNIHFLTGDNASALAAYEKALPLYQQVGGKLGEANVCSSQGDVYFQTGDSASALKAYEKALPLYQQVGNKWGEANVYKSQGDVYLRTADNASALAAYAKALPLYQEVGWKVGEANVHLREGDVYFNMGDNASALGAYEKALPLYQQVGSKSGAANVYRGQGKVSLKVGENDRALELLQRALRLNQQIGVRFNEALCQADMGRVYEAQKMLPEAVEAYEAAVDCYEFIRARAGSEEMRAKFTRQEDVTFAYERLTLLLLQVDRPEEAEQVVQRARSAALLSSLKGQKVVAADPALADLIRKAEELEQKRERLRTLRSEQAQKPSRDGAPLGPGASKLLSQAEALMAQTEQELNVALTRIKQIDPNFTSLFKVDPSDWFEEGVVVPEGCLLIQYFPTETQLVIFLLDSDNRPELRRVEVSRAELTRLVQQYRTVMAASQQRARAGQPVWAGEGNDFKDDGTDRFHDEVKPLKDAITGLYTHLITPIEPEVKRSRVVVVMPFGVLFYVPFATLGQATPDGGLRFLIEEKPLVTMTDRVAFKVMRQNAKTVAQFARLRHLVAFANPDGSLPATEEEVGEIGKLFAQKTVYKRQEATRARAKDLPMGAGSAAVVAAVHFATHGQVKSEDLTESYLKLADGPLRVADIYGLPLKQRGIRLAALSACQTFVGQENPGVEVLGLADAFAKAGAATVVASLWNVADKSTAELMVEFYKGMQPRGDSEGAGKAEALRQAQLKLLRSKEWAHPFYWGPFILIGEWR